MSLPMSLPTLYSLQHCPYAMRARLGILLAGQQVMLRPITMHNKPEEMLTASPKGTVPVLILNNDYEDGKSKVIDESLDIMLWALNRNDPQNLLYSHQNKGNDQALTEMLEIITENDQEFKPSLENYKRAKRFHHDSEEADRLECEPFIQRLESRLNNHDFFMGPTPSLLDYALLSFIRQFAKVNKPIFRDGPYKNLQRWLEFHLQSRIFARAMIKYPLWMDSGEESLFGNE
ncbi:MAG: glutathione S-transferase [Cocleimonas sp.]|jgi:glutathione S-transferase